MLSNVAVRLHMFPASTSRQLAIVKDTAMSYTGQPPPPHTHLLINPRLAVVIRQVL